MNPEDEFFRRISEWNRDFDAPPTTCPVPLRDGHHCYCREWPQRQYDLVFADLVRIAWGPIRDWPT